MQALIGFRGEQILIDNEDYDYLSQFEWHVRTYKSNTYALTAWYSPAYKVGVLHMPMHRMILDPEPGVYVDHIDGNGLNNQRSNLRLCTHQENMMNQKVAVNPYKSSIYKGVSRKDANSTKWRSLLYHSGKKYSLGTYDTELEAALAYDIKAKEVFGEFAKTNF